MRRYGTWLALALLLPYVVFFGGGWFGIYASALRTVSVALATAGLALWAVVAWRRPDWRPHSVLLPPIIVALGSLALSTAASRFPRQSVEYLGYAIILAALYLLLVRLLANSFFRVRIGTMTVALGAVTSIVYLSRTFAQWVDWWGLVGRLTVPPLRPGFESLTLGNPAAVMTLAVLLFAASVGVIGVGSRVRVAVCGALGTAVLLVTIVSGSRAGWIAVVAATVAVGAIAVSRQETRHRIALQAKRLSTRTAARIAVVTALVAGLGGSVALGPAVVARLGSGGEDLRAAYLAAATRMFSEAPLLGTGPGTWVIQRVRYTYAPEPDYYIPHAHNVYAQTLSELGVGGAIAGVFLLFQLARLLRDAIRDTDPVRRRWGWVAAFGLLYFGAHQVLDFYPNMPAALFAAALPVAWLDASAPSSIRAGGPGSPFRRAVLVGPVVVVLVACLGMLWTERAASVHASAVTEYNEGHWQEADALATRAAAEDPSWPPYQFTLGLTAARVGDHERAATAFRRSAAADDLPEAWLDLAAEEAARGGEAPAREALGRAARLGLQRPALAIAIGDLALRLGDSDLAITAFVAAIQKAPSLAGDPWWHLDAAREAMYAATVDDALAADDQDAAWQIALASGDSKRAVRTIQAATDAARLPPMAASRVDIVEAWDGDLGAWDRVVRACVAWPSDYLLIPWCGRIANRIGDTTTADRFAEWAYLLLEPDGATHEIRVAATPPIGRTIAGAVADFYGTYTYRRPTPWNPLVPTLVQLEVK